MKKLLNSSMFEFSSHILFCVAVAYILEVVL